jgi:hypothetical protein
LSPAGQAALAAAQALAKRATAPATLRAYKADWTHFSQWCAAHGFVPVPAAPAIVGAYLASLAGSHAPATIRRRLSALGKMHRFNDLAWNPAHRDIQGPLQGALRTHARPPQKAAAVNLAGIAQGDQHLGNRVGADGWFIACSAAASFSRLLDTHSSGRIGSPIVAGSTNRRRSSSTVGSTVLESGRPAPLRRIRVVAGMSSMRSFAPRMIVLRATPVARDTAAVPP